MSYWGNDAYGDCVSAEEAFAKAAAAPQTFIPEATVVAWAKSNGYLNGAVVTTVLSTMQSNGFSFDGKIFGDGPHNKVGWSDPATLASAIYNSGPVKIGVSSDDFETYVTPGESGWTMYGYPPNQKEDHCVSLCGYGDTLAALVALFLQRGITVNPPSVMPPGPCYAMFTWNSIGIIDRQSMLNMTYEAWIRNPVTFIRNDSVYLTTHGNDGIWGFDTICSGIPSQVLSTAGLGFTGVIVVDDTLYLITQGSDGIWTFDLTTRVRPVMIGSTAGLGFTDMVSVGNTLYLTTHGSDGIWTFDLTTQARPVQIAKTAGLGFTGVIAVGNTLYLTTQGNDGIWTFDLTTQARPVQIGSSLSLGFTGVIAVDNILYLTTQGNDGIWTFDLTTQARPAQIGMTAGLGFTDMIAVGNTLYLTTHGSDGIWTFDLTTRARPVQISTTAGLGFTGIISVS